MYYFTHTLLYKLHHKAYFSYFSTLLILLSLSLSLSHTHTLGQDQKRSLLIHMEKVKLKGNGRENGHLISFERDYYGFPWPQRNYKCTFCPKEFKSAQALGGHMNVHRRDRARLRQSPSLDPPNPNPNPNPNFSSHNSSSFSAPSTSSTAVRFVPYPPNLYQHSLVSSRDEERVPLIAHSFVRDFVGPQLGDIKKKLSMGMGSNVGEFKGLVLQENGVWKKRMGMELELGLKVGGLDLELRLGQSKYM